MQYRKFGNTDLMVSEIGFGAWGIGGDAYGSVNSNEALNALHEAEECGCNLIDTARVYGNSEELIGKFLAGRRERWLIASKYSGQKPGLESTLNEQLRRLKTDIIDFYQLHWAPTGKGAELYEELEKAKKAGKIRYYGVSLYSKKDIQYILKHTSCDGFQLKMSLVDTEPFNSAKSLLKEFRPGLLIRSTLKEGTLTGKFNYSRSVIDSLDQRSKWSNFQWWLSIYEANQFKTLETETRALRDIAISYPLSFPEVSCVLVGCKSASQVRTNMNGDVIHALSTVDLEKIRRIQHKLGLEGGWRKYVRKVINRLSSHS